MAVLPKMTYRISAIFIKILTSIFSEMKNPILKFIWNCRGLQMNKTVLKKNRIGGFTLEFQNLLQSYSN